MPEFVKVAKTEGLTEGEGTLVEVQGKRIALFKSGGEIYALDDTCTHEGGPLSEGFVEDGEVEYPWHGATFDLKTGECSGPPADEDVAAYPVRASGDDVEVEV